MLMLPTSPFGAPWRDEFDWASVNYAPVMTIGVAGAAGDLVGGLGQELVHRARCNTIDQAVVEAFDDGR